MDEPSPPIAKPRVLVVEDEPGVRTAMCLLLEFSGFACTPAIHGCDALEKMSVGPHDIVITDYMMPRMDGLSLARAIRDDARSSRVPVVLVTGVPPGDAIPAGLVSRVLRKPVKGDVLTQVVWELLGNARRRPG